MEAIGIIVAIFIVFIIILVIAEYNSIKTLQNKIKQSRSGIDVALTKRFDLIPNLVECVKGYCEHEEKALKEVTEARTEYLKNKSLRSGELVNSKCGEVLLLAEKYPSLKASSQFIELQASLERTENSLAASRRLYNSDVSLYNTKIQTFPANLVAGFMGAIPADFFEADLKVKENIKVKI